MQDTVLSSSQRYEISRGVDAVSGKPLVTKSVMHGVEADAAWAELLNEAHILGRLRDAPGCLQWRHLDKMHRHLVVDDFAGVALDRSGLLGQVELPEFLLLAERLTNALASIHAHGITHKDINPSNVLVRIVDRQVQVIDFGLATTFSDEHPEFEHQSKIRGTLAYISPEQTGRMNRPVDYRTDLYALGCTLYHLATGTAPFAATDPLTLVHAHLARPPKPPCELAPWLPVAVSDLILDLMAKEPDLRYQSAVGLAGDLQLYAQRLAAGGPLETVQRRQNDRMISPRPPRRLYGRTADIAALQSGFAQAVSGGMHAMMVKGYSGVGKTSLVHEIHRSVTTHQGFFISGKFDQFAGQPFSAPAQCLRQLCQLLLSESEALVEHWREQVMDALGPDASALFSVVPEVQALLGACPPVPDIGPIESQLRLRGLLVAFVRAVTAPAHPLVIFIDDLQWADQPSLDFIAALLQEPDLHGLLLIGAYRDNEVDAAHPLTILLRGFEAAGNPVPELGLQSLALTDTADMVADMLHMQTGGVKRLADVIYAKTGGNPFYTVEFLNTLYRDGVLTLNSPTGSWQWDDAILSGSNAYESVLDFLAQRLSSLPDTTRQVLLMAACLGHEFEIGALSLAAGLTPQDLTVALLPALEQGILVTPSAVRFQQADLRLNIRFCHDRMQQGAYHLCTPSQRMDLHLRIAKRFASSPQAQTLVMRIAQHFVQAAPLLQDPQERAVARNLIAAAARQARQAGAFASAESWLQVAIQLLPADPWNLEPEVTFALYAELHMALFSLARYAEVDAVFANLVLHTHSPVVLVESACIQVVSLSNRTRYAEAVALASQLMERLGMAMPQSDSLMPALQEEMGLFHAYVKAGALETLPQTVNMTDPAQLAIGQLLSRTVPAAFFGQPLVSLWCILRGARLWVDGGYFPEANYLMACVLLPAISFGDDYANGYRAGRLSLEAGQLRGPEAEIARTRHVFSLFNSHWFEPLEASIDHAHEAHRSLRRLGDLEIACFIYYTSLAGIFECADRLDEVLDEFNAADSLCEKTGNRHAQDAFVVFRQLVRALEGKTVLVGGFGSPHFCEQTHAQAVVSNPMAHAFYRTYRAVSACIFGDAPALLEHSNAAVELMPFITGFYPTALAHFVHALALAGQCAKVAAQERVALLARLVVEKNWLARRGVDAAMNFAHLHDLVDAEHLDLLDQPWPAHQAFERAMAGAQAHQRAWHHALIAERFALFQIRRGQESTGRLLLAQAHRLYKVWGAVGKVQQMQTSWPFLGAPSHSYSQQPGSHASSHTELDHNALLLASQSLSSETSLPRLVAILIEIVTKITGATGCIFLLADDTGQWFVEGGAVGKQTLLRKKAADCESQVFSGSVMRLALKLGQPVVCEDAVQDKRFARDPYFQGMPQCSVLGFPVLVRGRSAGYLVVENRLMHAAFSAEQVKSVAMLAGQLAISIENARLYESLESRVAQRTQELEISNAKLAALSSTDGLTGIANRRRFDEVLAAEWARSKRDGQPLSVAMLDVDWFKKYNDHYGHQAGDECLRQVARVFAANVRRSGDLAARYGGEEFVLIAPNTDRDAALRMAVLICQAVEQLAQPHAESPYGCVTASMGVATLVPSARDSADLLLKQADEALYLAKAQGRNRVNIALPS